MSLRKFLPLLLAAAALLPAQVSLTTQGSAYTQNFDTLANSATGTALPAGWLFLETGANANAIYTAGTGSSNSGDTYSFGAAASTERALGGLQSGSLTPTIGASFTNNTGGTITSLDIAYTGEQWRLGTASRVDRLDFQYSTNATTLATGTWTDVNQLDFTAPVTAIPLGALNGNTAANRTAISFTITGLNIAPGATFYIRWNSFDGSGADDGLAVDDFSLTPQGSSGGPAVLSINDVSQAEGNAGTTNFTFTVSLSAPAPAGGVTFDIATADNTATVAGADYQANALTSQTIAAGLSTYTFTVFVTGDTGVEPNETFFVNVTNITGATAGDAQGQGTILNEDVSLLSIHDVQGAGTASPLVGQVVTVRGIVTALRTNGFFVQEPDAAVDVDPATSEGILVFTSSAPPAAAVIGASVQVTGTVTEFTSTGNPALFTTTELTSPTVVQLSTGNPLPMATVLTTANLTPTGGLTQLERYEGMLLSIPSMRVVAATDGNVSEPNATATSNGVFFGVLHGVATPVREAGIETPLATPLCAAGVGCAIPVFDSNPERIRVDSDAIAGQTALNVGVGVTLTNVAGVLDHNGSAYTLYTTQAPTVGGTAVSATPIPQAPAGTLTVTAMNVERLFDAVNDPGVSDPVLTPGAYANRLGKISLAIRNNLRTPDVIALSEVESLTVAQDLATRINSDAVANAQPDPGYLAYLVEGNDVGGIDVGFLVKPSAVSVVSVTQLEAGTTYTDPCTGAQATLNDRPPLRLRGTATKGGPAMDFTVFVNHLRSLNGVSDETPCSLATDGARVRAKRAAQANNVAKVIQDELTANPAARILAVGDFNAFEVNDGYVDTINTIMGTPAPATQVAATTADPTYANMTNLLSLLQATQRYSYVFDGNHQTLDHALINPAAMQQLVGGGYARLNAEFPETFRGDFNRPERYSDHDPAFAYLTTAANITAQTAMTRAGILYNRTALTATSRITVRNNTASPMAGPLSLVISGLPNGVTLTNANAALGAGYVYNLAAPLAPGQSVTVNLMFSLNAIGPINYTANVFSGTL
jgi:predicted extracellular nuclease